MNARDSAERARAQALLEDLSRLRKDAEVFEDVIGWRGNRVPITAVAGDIADPQDPGLKKAIARVKRTVRRSE